MGIRNKHRPLDIDNRTRTRTAPESPEKFIIIHFIDGDPVGHSILNAYQAIQFASSFPEASWIAMFGKLNE